MQLLKHQRPVVLHQVVRLFLQKVPAFVAHFAVKSRQLFLGTVASMAAFLPACNLLVSAPYLLFCIAVKTRIFDEDSITKCRKRNDDKINANLFFRWMEGHGRVKLILGSENSIPLVALSRSEEHTSELQS